jgi:2-polyprenyl-3-methyl-5-hydroxy-6-metoxy-1,4-benzoquinol methylase
MESKQINLIADVRYPTESRDLAGDKWSQWSSLPMIELSAIDTCRFFRAMIPHPGQKILEIGCGNGYLSLELARDGHEVVGLDISSEIIAMAERTRTAHPEVPLSGKLTYYCADINTWQASEGSFDVVIINRTLHHIHPLQTVIAKVRDLLRQGGAFICQDYAYDRLNEQTVSWMYAMLRLLFLGDCSDEDPAITSDDARSIEMLRTAWFQRADQRLNRYEEMLQVLQATFHQQFFSWFPYLFVYIGNGMRKTLSEEKERELLTFLKNIEHHLIEIASIQAVGFRYVGIV